MLPKLYILVKILAWDAVWFLSSEALLTEITHNEQLRLILFYFRLFALRVLPKSFGLKNHVLLRCSFLKKLLYTQRTTAPIFILATLRAAVNFVLF